MYKYLLSGTSMDHYTTVDLWAFLKQDMNKQVHNHIIIASLIKSNYRQLEPYYKPVHNSR